MFGHRIPRFFIHYHIVAFFVVYKIACLQGRIPYFTKHWLTDDALGCVEYRIMLLQEVLAPTLMRSSFPH